MPRFCRIEDPVDPKIAAYRDVRERDLRGRDGLFMAEGEVVLRAWLAGGRFPVVSLLLSERMAAKLADPVATLGDAVTVFVAAQDVLDAIAGFPMHRGVLGLGQRGDEAAAVLQDIAPAPRPLRLLVLLGIANHDNMGGLFRNAAAFGVDGVLLDAACCDPLYRKAIRVSVGASLRVRFGRLAAGEDPVAWLERAAIQAVALTPDGSMRLRLFEPPPRLALILGAEGPGLSRELTGRVATLGIPMARGWDSVNVATAAAIALHAIGDSGAGKTELPKIQDKAE